MPALDRRRWIDHGSKERNRWCSERPRPGSSHRRARARGCVSRAASRLAATADRSMWSVGLSPDTRRGAGGATRDFRTANVSRSGSSASGSGRLSSPIWSPSMPPRDRRTLGIDRASRQGATRPANARDTTGTDTTCNTRATRRAFLDGRHEQLGARLPRAAAGTSTGCRHRPCRGSGRRPGGRC